MNQTSSHQPGYHLRQWLEGDRNSPYTILHNATSPQLTSQVSIPAKMVQGWRKTLVRPYSWYSSPSTYDKRHGTRVEKTPLRVPKSNGTLDTATLAKIIQGWRRLPLGYQKTAGPPPMAESRRVTPPPAEGRFTAGPLPMAAEPSDHPATRRGPVYSGTTADGRRAVGSPRHPPMAGVQRDHRRWPQSRQITPPPTDGRCTARQATYP